MEIATCKKSSEEKSILWSLKPVLIYTKISGLATYQELGNKSCTAHRILGYFWFILSLICLFLNCFFQIFNCVEDIKRRFLCAGQSRFYSVQLVPYVFGESLISCLRPIFVAGVPLIFAYKFYFYWDIKKIVSSIHEIEKKITLPDTFYRKCRNGFLLLIAISLLVGMMDFHPCDFRQSDEIFGGRS